MKKIPTVFVRNPDDRRYVTDRVTPGCEWVLAGDGRATRKWDGTCVMLAPRGDWWARREVKPGKQPPPGWHQIDADPVTGKRVGWEPIEQSSHYRAFLAVPVLSLQGLRPGTYELCGPRINGNPEGLEVHALVRHGLGTYSLAYPVTYDDLRGLLIGWPHEGLVWHHPDGRMAKLKVRDLPTDGAGQ